MKPTKKQAAYPQPWDNEPDSVKFTYRGYRCWVKRNLSLGVLCGYVALTPDDKFFEADYDSPLCSNLTVWGGLTYSGWQQDRFWLGFDCAHATDLIPQQVSLRQAGMLGPAAITAETYKDVAFVKNELRQLVDQLIDQQ